MQEEKKVARWGKPTTYERWMRHEGLPVVEGYGVADVRVLELGPWERLGGRGTFIQLVGMEGLTGLYVAEIPPGATLAPEKHLYEELVYILSGRGATEVWSGERERRGSEGNFFEWQADSFFALPVNAWHRLSNGSGVEPVSFLAATTAPLVMDLFHNPDFVFGCDYPFSDRYDGSSDYFREVRERRLDGRSWTWVTNFIPNVRAATVDPSYEAEKEGWKRSTAYEMGSNVLVGHIEDWPAGRYDEAHHHTGGAILLIVRGQGYSLLWPQGAGIRPYQDGHADQVVRVNWQPGSVLSPPTGWFHQHFCTGPDPVRFVALRYGSRNYGVGFNDVHFRAGVQTSIREGGTLVEYRDEDPEIRRQFERALAEVGSRMPSLAP